MSILTFSFLNLLYLGAVEVTHSPEGGVKNILSGRGLDLTFTGMIVVFAGLIILTMVLVYQQSAIQWVKKVSASIMNIGSKKPEESPAETGAEKTDKQVKTHGSMTADEVVAACMAIILYKRMHMGEHQEYLTTRTELKNLSPWSLAGKMHSSRRLR